MKKLLDIKIAPPLLGCFDQIKWPLAAVAGFSFVSNLLFFALPLYLMQVYGRVIVSHSLETLLFLTIIAIFAFAISAVLDDIRSRILVRVGSIIDKAAAGSLFSAMVRARIAATGASEKQAGSQTARDLDSVRQGIAGSLTTTILDLPWTPIFLAAIFAANFWIGFGALLGAVLLVALALLNRHFSRPLLDDANRAAVRSYAMAESALRNSEVLHAMGMEETIGKRWAGVRSEAVMKQQAASSRSGTFGSAVRFVRMALQVLIIAGVALLVLDGHVGAGVMFAAMILFARALAPIEKLVGSWQSFVDAGYALRRLNDLLLAAPTVSFETQLPRMAGRVDFENVTYAPPGSGRPTLKGVKLSLAPGETLGVIGPSGAGKSTFLKLAAGVLSPSMGLVRVDGADIRLWDRSHFGRFVGYLPQDVELFSGTVSENICRFQAPEAQELFKAARLAGVHDMILRLPLGYDTQLGDGGSVLSAGQRQRIGLARAIYRMPRLLLLDEPNASLDGDGEAALYEVLKILKASKATVIIISHRPTGLATADKVLFLRDGTAEQFGPRDLVLAQLKAAQAAARQSQDRPIGQVRAAAGGTALAENAPPTEAG